jgi:BirA family biotin operon repressor/biotin-[acetyl-CoA-carboxylase] ligase
MSGFLGEYVCSNNYRTLSIIDSRKTAGILTEEDGEIVYTGMGVNVAPSRFPEAFRAKATSLALAMGEGAASGVDSPFLLLEKILQLDRPETGDGS